MSLKRGTIPFMSVLYVVGSVVGVAGCQASAKANFGEEAKTPAPPAPAPTPDPKPEPPKPEPVAAPPPKPVKALGKAKIENNEIKIPGKIHFDTDKATIKEDKETKEILQTVADVMKENTQITKLRIEGHTDDTGGDDHNMKLSQDRAQAVVEWLAKNGVDKARLDPKGWGEHHGLVKNDSKEHKEQNRRVEFRLWELEGKPTDAQKAEAGGATPSGGAGGAAAAAPAAGGGTVLFAGTDTGSAKLGACTVTQSGETYEFTSGKAHGTCVKDAKRGGAGPKRIALECKVTNDGAADDASNLNAWVLAHGDPKKDEFNRLDGRIGKSNFFCKKEGLK
jgi:outer membrane protein OmpA-like peptidoglycan-associated protein